MHDFCYPSPLLQGEFMKIMLLVTTLLTSFILSSQYAESKVLKIMVDDFFPPFSFKDQENSIKGIDIDMLNEVSKRLNLTFKISLTPWKRLLMMTKRGYCDGAMALFKTAEREKYAIFTHPIHYSTYKIFVRKDYIFSFTKVEDLFGKRIGLEAGFSISDDFDAAAKNKKIIIESIFDPMDFFRRLTRPSIDAFVGNDAVIKHYLKTVPKLENMRNTIVDLPKPIKESRGAFFVLSKKSPLKNKEQLNKQITTTLKQLFDEGYYKKIYEKYTR